MSFIDNDLPFPECLYLRKFVKFFLFFPLLQLFWTFLQKKKKKILTTLYSCSVLFNGAKFNFSTCF